MNRLLKPAALLSLVMLASQAAAALFGSDEPDAHWRQQAASSQVSLDTRGWQQFLDTYLVSDAADGIHRVRYGEVTTADRQVLDRWIDAQARVSPPTLDRNQQMAYWINLYNALTVQLILDHPGIDSIRDIGSGLFSPGPWSRKLIEVDGRPLTLDDIEHSILRPVYADARVHFAVNCASMGCPNLSTRAFEAATLDTQLDSGARGYINHRRGVRFDADGELHLSAIFDWYRQDFPADTAPFMTWLARYAQEPLASRLRGYNGSVSHDYDWSLNAP